MVLKIRIFFVFLLASAAFTAGAGLDCGDAAEVAEHLDFARSTFSNLAIAKVSPKFHVVEEPEGSGNFVAIATEFNEPFAMVNGIYNASRETFIVHNMTVLDSPRPRRKRLRISPGAPFILLQWIREHMKVTTLRVHVNTEVYEALRARSRPVPTREHFMAHWAGFDFAGIERVPLYQIEDAGHQTWLIFKPAPIPDPNDKLLPGYKERPIDPVIR